MTAAPPIPPPSFTRPRPRWVVAPPPDDAAVARLAEQLHLPEIVCRLLVVRGLAEPELAKRYLRPRLDQLHAPDLMLDLTVAVDRLARAVQNGETVLVHGDYDVDGMSSTALLTRTIRTLGGKAIPFIPRRLEDGYDLSAAGVTAAVATGASVVLTADCGTSARAAIAELCARGIDVIVADHHLPGGDLPSCLAVLNPRRVGCTYPDKDLAAVGVAFKLALALTTRLGADENAVFGMLDLVALATVADIAPLRGENRVLVRTGLRLLNRTRNHGLRALIRASGLEGKPLTAGRIGFVLAPRLNAVGRLKHALRGVELLMTDNEHDANVIARDLEELNRERQEIDRRTLVEAKEQLDAMDVDSMYGIVLASDQWHPGVIGIVASRIVEEYCRPTMLIAVQGSDGKGSGRSIPAFDLHGALGECSNLLLRYGGHRAAAGITIAPGRIPAFAERFNAVAASRLTRDQLAPDLRIDLTMSADDLHEDLETLLRHFEPHGLGNPGPTFLVRGARLSAPPRVVGTGGLKLRIATTRGDVDAIGWGLALRLPELTGSETLDLVVRLERDEWNGLSRLQAKVLDFTAPKPLALL